ncbi:MAG: hypothetical protein C5B54_03005 [Acidobacteria bacterium]|nr:MAG: hypothetical protein C5B54_03005 [Acidobacteriota bacterium]
MQQIRPVSTSTLLPDSQSFRISEVRISDKPLHLQAIQDRANNVWRRLDSVSNSNFCRGGACPALLNPAANIQAGQAPPLLFLLFFFIILAGCTKTQPPPKTQTTSIRHIYLITIDTLRPDALSIYGGKTTTPFFDEFAKQSVVFDHAFTCAPITLPAHTSLLTGLYPQRHGVRNNGTFRAPDSLNLISEIAKENGFATAAIIGGFPLTAQFGLNQGFDLYDDHFSQAPSPAGTFSYSERNAEQVRLAAQTWIQQQKHPFFIWMHFFDPHHPYLEHGMQNVAPYQQEVLYVDQQLKLFFDFLKQNKLDQDALVVITADHGEAFGEHGEVSHSLFVYNTTLRIPLLIHGPGLAPGRRTQIVRIIDLAPTILDFMQWKPKSGFDGVTLSNVLKQTNWKPVDAYAESFAPAIDFGWSPLRSIQDAKGKYIEATHREFYDLNHDPEEKENRIKTAAFREYEQKLHRLGQTPSVTPTHTLTPEDRDRLESFGYFSSAPTKFTKDAPDPKDKVAIAREIAELSMSPSTLPEKAHAYAKIVQQDPSNPLLLLRYAEILLKMKQYKEAEQTFQHVLDLEYPSAAAYNGLATVYFSRNDLNRAQQMLKQAEGLHLADGETYYNLGEFALAAGNPDGASTYYEHSMQFGFLPAFYKAAQLKELGGGIQDGIQILQKAEQTAPSDAQVNNEIGLLYFRHAKWDDAVAEFKKALAKNPQDASAYYNMGLAFYRAGRNPEAKQSLEEFLRLAPAEWKQQRFAAHETLSHL